MQSVVCSLKIWDCICDKGLIFHYPLVFFNETAITRKCHNNISLAHGTVTKQTMFCFICSVFFYIECALPYDFAIQWSRVRKLITHTPYFNSKLIWWTVNRQMCELISMELTRCRVLCVVWRYEIIQRTRYMC